MSIVVAGNESGLLDSSLRLLSRNDRTDVDDAQVTTYIYAPAGVRGL